MTSEEKENRKNSILNELRSEEGRLDINEIFLSDHRQELADLRAIRDSSDDGDLKIYLAQRISDVKFKIESLENLIRTLKWKIRNLNAVLDALEALECHDE